MLSDPERAVKRGTGAGLVRAVRRKDAGRSLAATEPAPNVATSLVFRQTRIQSGVEEEVLGPFTGHGAGADESADGGRGTEGCTGPTG